MKSRRWQTGYWKVVLGTYVAPILIVVVMAFGGAYRSLHATFGHVSLDNLEFAGLVLALPVGLLSIAWCVFAALARYYKIIGEAQIVVFTGFLYLSWRVGMWIGEALVF